MNNSLYQVKLECPVCQAAFVTSRVRSKKCIVEDRDTDFCVYYKGCNPIFYDAVVCEECGYAAMFDSFSNISPEDAKAVYDKLYGKWIHRSFDGERTIEDAMDAYKLVILCGQMIRNVPNNMLASACMRLAWLYRMTGDVDQENRFLGYALEQYSQIFDRGKMPERMDEITLIYLIGELNRRLGNQKDAVMWFNMAVSHEESSKKPLIVRMAREQWSRARNRKEEEN